MTPEDIQRLGAKLSRSCEWDVISIVAVMMEALTDANFHSLRTRLEDAFNNYIEDEGKL